MDIQNNKKLLIIYNDIDMLNTIYSNLKDHFTTVHKEYDPIIGYNQAILIKPDIIICNSIFESKSSFELITDLQEKLPLAKIVVFGAKSDDFLLCEMLDLQNIYTVNISENIDGLKKLIKKFNPIDPIIADIKDLIHKVVIFHNNYKGIEIINNHKIIAIKEDTFLVKVSSIQYFSIQYQKYSILEYKYKYILAFLDKLNNNNIISLKDPRYINYKKRTNDKRLKVDSKFRVGIYYNNTHLDISVIDVSYKACCIIIKNNIDLKVGQSLDLTLGFELAGIGAMSKEKKFVKIFAKSKIIRIEDQNNNKKVVLSLTISKSNQREFQRYLKNREIEIISQLKQYKKKLWYNK
jgi:hypothetical protein